jgi:CheY-like chemotaxis protein
MPDGGTVTIRLTHVQTLPAKLAATTDNTRNPLGYAVLSVRDTGHGMNEDMRARLFEPFFTTKAETGTGLGLAIVYTIVQQCQGHIGVASTPQGGTTFTVYLPLCAPLRRSPEKTELGSVVCLVDDDDTFRPVLARAVRRAGYDVLTACSGKDALRVIADAPKIPELLVTDVHMPGLDGVELARRLRASHPRLKILFISGHEASVCDPAVSSPDAAFLRKPFTGAALVQEIERLLDAPVVTPAIATSRATL